MTALESMVLNPFSQKGPEEDYNKKSQGLKRAEQLEDPKVIEALNVLITLHGHKNLRTDDVYAFVASLSPMDPYRISLLVDRIQQEPDLNNGISPINGTFISGLIQHSYSTGHNGFMIMAGDSPTLGVLHGIGYASGKDKLSYRLMGVIRSVNNLYKCRGTHQGIMSTAGIFNHCSECDLLVYDDIGDCTGYGSYGCNIELFGKVGDKLADYSKNSIFTLHSTVGSSSGEKSFGCTFKAVLPQTYFALLESVGKGNTIQLISQKGYVLEEVKR